MVVYVDNNDNVIWINEDDTVKEKFVDDDNCIVVNKVIDFAKHPVDGYIYVQKFNRETQEIYAEKTNEKYEEIKPVEVPVTLEDIKKDIQPISKTTQMTAEDALTIIEYLMMLEGKIDALSVK